MFEPLKFYLFKLKSILNCRKQVLLGTEVSKRWNPHQNIIHYTSHRYITMTVVAIMLQYYNKLQIVVSDDGSKPEVPSRNQQAMVALTKLKPFGGETKINGLTGEPHFHIHLSVCLWDMIKDTNTSEMRCYQSLLNISFKNNVTNDDVHKKI